jgi:methylenetetrahydrofolate reductase (NADPH)
VSKTTFSFEFFPPKTDELAEKLWPEVSKLMATNPKYMTVTYGAGGSTKDGTLAALNKILGMTDIPLASHLTFLSTTKADLDEYVEKLWNAGVKHIVALRGDLPRGTSFDDFVGDEYYDYTSNFVKALKAKHDFEISVGAYPEKHPDAPSLEADIAALKLKCDAGADRAITQFFFDNNVFYDFAEACDKAGITTPMCPGLLAIHDFTGMCGFAKKCEANVPDWLHERFDGLEDKPEEARKVALDLLVSQTEDLAKNGVPHIHYYAMNKSDMTVQAVESIK